MVPLLSGPFPPEILATENPMRFMTEKVKTKHPNFRVLEGTCTIYRALGCAENNVICVPTVSSSKTIPLSATLGSPC